MTIGTSIRKGRKRIKLTQAQLAEKVGISTTAICQIELGRSEPSKHNLRAIADVLGIPVPVLVFMSLEKSDVPEHKRDIYDAIYPTLKHLAGAFFNMEDQ